MRVCTIDRGVKSVCRLCDSLISACWVNEIQGIQLRNKPLNLEDDRGWHSSPKTSNVF